MTSGTVMATKLAPQRASLEEFALLQYPHQVPQHLGQCHQAGMAAQNQGPAATLSTRSSSLEQDQPFDHALMGGKKTQLRKIFVKRNTMSVEYFFLRSALSWGKKKKEEKADFK